MFLKVRLLISDKHRWSVQAQSEFILLSRVWGPSGCRQSNVSRKSLVSLGNLEISLVLGKLLQYKLPEIGIIATLGYNIWNIVHYKTVCHQN